METEPTKSLTDRFARFIERLCAVIGVYGGVFPWAGPLVAAAQGRVRRFGERFALLAARASGGKIRVRRKGAARGPDAARRRPPILSATMAWLMEAVGAAFHCAEAFNRLLDDPEMAHLVAAAPQAGRILRPLCRMLRVKRPAYLRPPRRAPAQGEVSRTGPLGEPLPNPHPEPPPQGAQGGRENDAAAGRPPQPWPPPAPPRSQAEEEAIRYAARPGGLYWNGTGFRWS
jgi:hypothetical protein